MDVGCPQCITNGCGDAGAGIGKLLHDFCSAWRWKQKPIPSSLSPLQSNISNKGVNINGLHSETEKLSASTKSSEVELICL